MSRICKCCKEENMGIVCVRCGFDSAISLDNSKESVEEYRDKVITRISDFSIVAYTYKMNEKNNKLELLNKKVNRIADAKDIYLKVYWSKETYAQDIYEKAKERVIEISYMVNDVKHETSVCIQPIQDDRMMSVGLSLDEELCLTVYLGRDEKYAKSEKVRIVLM